MAHENANFPPVHSSCHYTHRIMVGLFIASSLAAAISDPNVLLLFGGAMIVGFLVEATSTGWRHRRSIQRNEDRLTTPTREEFHRHHRQDNEPRPIPGGWKVTALTFDGVGLTVVAIVMVMNIVDPYSTPELPISFGWIAYAITLLALTIGLMVTSRFAHRKARIDVR